MLDDWNLKLNKAIGEIKSLIDKDELALISAKREMNRDISDDKKLFDEALKNYSIILKGKGVHNFEYSEEILNQVKATLNQIWKKYEVMGRS